MIAMLKRMRYVGFYNESKKNIYWKYERLGGLQTQFVRW